MKFATYQDGSRDGQLLVVSRDLSQAHYASHIANRLQQVLDDWNYLSPQLQDLSDALNGGKARHVFPFDPQQCMAPLPRAYQCVVVPAYPAHFELLGRDAHQLAAQALAGDSLWGPHSAWVCPSEALEMDFEAGVAVITGDLPAGCPSDRALDGVRLLALVNGLQLRALQAQPAMAFSPVVVTPDELGDAWSRGRVQLSVQVTWNGRKVGACDAGADMGWHFGKLLAHLCQTRAVRAGSIVGAGPVCGKGVERKGRTEWPQGYCSIAHKRAQEARLDGQSATPYLRAGDTLRIDMKGIDGASVFGAIECEVVVPGGPPAVQVGS